MTSVPSLKFVLAAGPLLILALLLPACQAERSIVRPVEPDWSYHDGSDQLSNNDTWEAMIPTSALLPLDSPKLAHVEEATTD